MRKGFIWLIRPGNIKYCWVSGQELKHKKRQEPCRKKKSSYWLSHGFSYMFSFTLPSRTTFPGMAGSSTPITFLEMPADPSIGGVSSPDVPSSRWCRLCQVDKNPTSTQFSLDPKSLWDPLYLPPSTSHLMNGKDVRKAIWCPLRKSIITLHKIKHIAGWGISKKQGLEVPPSLMFLMLRF